MSGHQQSIFADNSGALRPEQKRKYGGIFRPVFNPNERIVLPCCIFAAGRTSFDVVVRLPFDADDALPVIFLHLPLAEYGWDEDATKISLVGASKDLWPIWRLERG